jgi:hypothetical protein
MDSRGAPRLLLLSCTSCGTFATVNRLPEIPASGRNAAQDGVQFGEKPAWQAGHVLRVCRTGRMAPRRLGSANCAGGGIFYLRSESGGGRNILLVRHGRSLSSTWWEVAKVQAQSAKQVCGTYFVPEHSKSIP